MCLSEDVPHKHKQFVAVYAAGEGESEGKHRQTHTPHRNSPLNSDHAIFCMKIGFIDKLRICLKVQVHPCSNTNKPQCENLHSLSFVSVPKSV